MEDEPATKLYESKDRKSRLGKEATGKTMKDWRGDTGKDLEIRERAA
jgi:hypothetical protein